MVVTSDILWRGGLPIPHHACGRVALSYSFEVGLGDDLL